MRRSRSESERVEAGKPLGEPKPRVDASGTVYIRDYDPNNPDDLAGNPVEVRTVSATGGAKGVKIARYDQIPPSVLRELAEHWGRGGEKYGHGNWRKGFEWWKSYRSAMGHLTAFWAGEDYDEETGSKHVIAAAWHCMALAWYMDNMPEYDTPETFRHNSGNVSAFDRTWSDSDDR